MHNRASLTGGKRELFTIHCIGLFPLLCFESTVVLCVLNRFGQFVAATLPIFPGANEKNLSLVEATPSTSIVSCEQGEGDEKGDRDSDSASSIVLRNRCLQLLHSLLFTSRSTVSLGYVELLFVNKNCVNFFSIVIRLNSLTLCIRLS
jgi:hypothetical protein